MARLARVVAVGVPHHVTQRGNGRRIIFATDSDRLVYLDLLRHYCDLYRLSLQGYCLMSNHIHLIATPEREDSLALTLKHTHGRYAAYWNVSQTGSGHVWQGRYYSCPLGVPYIWAALRYVELNPVRARMVSEPEGYAWSSAAVHCGTREPDAALDMELWRKEWTAPAWREFLADPAAEEENEALRQSTHTGRPFGSAEFIKSLEESMSRTLTPKKGGRPSKPADNLRQGSLTF
jgi:putative transposase